MKDKWQKAQIAERKHWESAHTVYGKEELPEPGKVQEFVRNQFKINLESLAGKNILEIGGGVNPLIAHINQANLKLNVDPLAGMLSKGLSNGYSAYAYQVKGLGERLPVKDNSFDAVIILNALDHSIGPCQVVSESRRVLQPGGIAILSVNVFPLPRLIRSGLWIVDRPHPHHLSSSEVLSILENAGFKVIHRHMRKFTLHDALSTIRRVSIASTIKRLFIPFMGAQTIFTTAVTLKPDTTGSNRR